MSIVYLTSDFHFGHKRVVEFRKNYGFRDEQDHRETIIENWNKVVTKRDLVYILGDVVFYKEFLPDLNKLMGRKIICLGNHCKQDYSTYELLAYVEEVYGIVRYKQSWFSHAPIAEEELRGKTSIHGHCHYATIKKPLYRNVCLENTLNFGPVEYQKVVKSPWEVLKEYPDIEQENKYIAKYKEMKAKEEEDK